MQELNTPLGPGLEVDDGFVRLTIVGDCSVAEAADRVDAAIRYSREIGIGKLLVDVRSATGAANPGVVDRYLLVKKWASSSAGHIKLAVIAQHDNIDKEKIGVTMAENRNFNADVFENESPALAWLLA